MPVLYHVVCVYSIIIILEFNDFSSRRFWIWFKWFIYINIKNELIKITLKNICIKLPFILYINLKIKSFSDSVSPLAFLNAGCSFCNFFHCKKKKKFKNKYLYERVLLHTAKESFKWVGTFEIVLAVSGSWNLAVWECNCFLFASSCNKKKLLR